MPKNVPKYKIEKKGAIETGRMHGVWASRAIALDVCAHMVMMLVADEWYVVYSDHHPTTTKKQQQQQQAAATISLKEES